MNGKHIKSIGSWKLCIAFAFIAAVIAGFFAFVSLNQAHAEYGEGNAVPALSVAVDDSITDPNVGITGQYAPFGESEALDYPTAGLKGADLMQLFAPPSGMTYNYSKCSYGLPKSDSTKIQVRLEGLDSSGNIVTAAAILNPNVSATEGVFVWLVSVDGKAPTTMTLGKKNPIEEGSSYVFYLAFEKINNSTAHFKVDPATNDYAVQASGKTCDGVTIAPMTIKGNEKYSLDLVDTILGTSSKLMSYTKSGCALGPDGIFAISITNQASKTGTLYLKALENPECANYVWMVNGKVMNPQESLYFKEGVNYNIVYGTVPAPPTEPFSVVGKVNNKSTHKSVAGASIQLYVEDITESGSNDESWGFPVGEVATTDENGNFELKNVDPKYLDSSKYVAQVGAKLYTAGIEPYKSGENLANGNMDDGKWNIGIINAEVQGLLIYSNNPAHSLFDYNIDVETDVPGQDPIKREGVFPVFNAGVSDVNQIAALTDSVEFTISDTGEMVVDQAGTFEPISGMVFNYTMKMNIQPVASENVDGLIWYDALGNKLVPGEKYTFNPNNQPVLFSVDYPTEPTPGGGTETETIPKTGDMTALAVFAFIALASTAVFISRSRKLNKK